MLSTDEALATAVLETLRREGAVSPMQLYKALPWRVREAVSDRSVQRCLRHLADEGKVTKCAGRPERFAPSDA